MKIPMNLPMWLAALAPIGTLLVLLLGFRWKAVKAGAVSLAVAVWVAVAAYRAELSLLLVQGAKGVWDAMIILLIISTAVLLYQVGEEADAFSAIREGMGKVFPNELLLILSMSWIFESFLQGITGFGVPVAVGAPLLVGIGVQPLWAVVLPLVGQSWGSTFGTLAASWDALAMCAGLSVGSAAYYQTALWAAGFIWIWNFLEGLMICWFYGRKRAVKKGLPAVLLLSVIQGGGEVLLSQLNPTLCCFLPACASLLAAFLLGKTRAYREPWRVADSAIMERKNEMPEAKEGQETMMFGQAFFPYILLSGLTLAVLLVKPLYTFLSGFSLSLSFPEVRTGYGYVKEAVKEYSPLKIGVHASVFLLTASLAGLLYYRKENRIQKGSVKRMGKRTLKMVLPSGGAVLMLVLMSKIMEGSGQTQVLSGGIVNAFGRGYLAVSPFVGFLGTFMTGSNMSSNILFTSFQMTTAELLKARTAVVLGAQTAGGAIGCALSPNNIVLGTTTAKIPGKEGEAMRKLLPMTVGCTALIGILTFFNAGL